MNKLDIDISPRQMSRLRNGHKVRVKKGTGCSVIVDPIQFSTATKCFAKNKGLEIQLSPEIIEANRSPEMSGQGIFGKKFDKALKKAGIKKLAYKAGDAVKPMLKEAIDQGLQAMGPEFAMAGAPVKDMLFQFLDKPADFGVGGKKGDIKKKMGNMANQYATEQLGFDPRMAYEQYNSNPYASQSDFMSGLRNTARQGAMDYLSGQTGENYGYMGRASQGGVDSRSLSDYYASMTDRRQSPLIGGFGLPRDVRRTMSHIGGNGLPRDFRRSMSHIGSKTKGLIGMGAGMIGCGNGNVEYLPQALMSQPFGANFQMQNMLPPQYHKFHSGTNIEGQGMYAGSYSGRGLYM